MKAQVERDIDYECSVRASLDEAGNLVVKLVAVAEYATNGAHVTVHETTIPAGYREIIGHALKDILEKVGPRMAPKVVNAVRTAYETGRRFGEVE